MAEFTLLCEPSRSNGEQIVDKESAVLGLAGSREEVISLQADHGNLCKYESETDPSYKQVARNLQDVMRKVVQEEAMLQKLRNTSLVDSNALRSSVSLVESGT